jgi:peptide deformylase
MSVRKCIPWPDKRLRTAAAEVAEITDDVRAVWQDLIDTMEAMPGKVVRMANPVILHSSVELREHDEASPNLPGVSAIIKRPRAVTVKFLNDKGIMDRREFVGLWATSVQHQIDHLNGKMYFDHLSRMKREMLIKKARKI